MTFDNVTQWHITLFQDLPSGYNSGEQYDTLSTGYMSGEAYELPETRPEIPEPTLASIDEVSHQSNEEIFSLGQNIYQVINESYFNFHGMH